MTRPRPTSSRCSAATVRDARGKKSARQNAPSNVCGEREHLKEMLSDAYDEDDLDDLESEQIKLSEYLDDD